MAGRTRVVVVGAGRLGRTIAGLLSHRGEQVIVVDRSEEAFNRLPAEFTGFKVYGNAADLATLHEAGLDKTERVFATTNDDNLNLMVALAASTVFGVPYVRARVWDPAREELYARLGVLTINPTLLAAESVMTSLAPVSR